MGTAARWGLAGLGAAGLLAVAFWAVSDSSDQAKVATPTAPAPRTTSPRPSTRATAPPPPAPKGLQLDGKKSIGRQSTAQAIYRAALLDLQRMESVDESRARDAYLRGRAALERVEDELDKDDEPGHVRLRTDTEALDTEMRRLYDQPQP